MSPFRNIQDSTVRIEYQSGMGSGFHFTNPEIIVTNHHVVEGVESSSSDAFAVTERGNRTPLNLLNYSPQQQHDFAIFEADGTLPPTRQALTPHIPSEFELGTEVAFAGFPHGVDDFLVQIAIVSGLVDQDHFYIDGSVNGGNSGGPIVDIETGSVIGIVTDRRFLGRSDLNDLEEASSQLIEASRSTQAGIQMGPINLSGVFELLAEGMILVQDALQANANTGIGVGYSIEFVKNEFDRLS